MKKKTTAVSEKLETSEFMVLGNCGMCEKIIEKAALSAGAATAEWDVKADLLKVTFNAKKTSTDAIQKAVALAGYDNAGYKADDAAYNKLHGCCKYDRTGAAGGAKSCTDSSQH
ncbi:MAG: copper chaperone [Saprospiraceae bacterium]|nr:copper chaperone [Saprospiraceae bacterium]